MRTSIAPAALGFRSEHFSQRRLPGVRKWAGAAALWAVSLGRLASSNNANLKASWATNSTRFPGCCSPCQVLQYDEWTGKSGRRPAHYQAGQCMAYDAHGTKISYSRTARRV